MACKKIKLKTKEERIQEEEKRIRASFKCVTDKKLLNIVDGLILRAAYMRVQLEIYELDITENGYTEQFTQSKDVDPYDRERVVARLYNNLNRNYQTIMKQLTDIISKYPQKEESDGLDEFCQE